MCRLADHGLLQGGAGAAGASVTSKFDSASDGASDATKPARLPVTVGSGRDDVDVKSPDEDKFKSPLTIRILRIPRMDELPKSGLPDPLFYTTVEIQAPTLADVFAAMQRQPEPLSRPVPPSGTQDEGPPMPPPWAPGPR